MKILDLRKQARFQLFDKRLNLEEVVAERTQKGRLVQVFGDMRQDVQEVLAPRPQHPDTSGVPTTNEQGSPGGCRFGCSQEQPVVKTTERGKDSNNLERRQGDAVRTA